MTALVPFHEIFPALQAATGTSAWYTDPIVIAMAVLAIFVVIDIAIMVARNGQRSRPHILS